MEEQQTGYTFDRVVRMVLTAATIVIVFVLLRFLSDVLLPFVAAVVLAYLLNPLVTLFEKKTGRRGLAVAITLVGLGIVALAIVATVVPLAAHQMSDFGHTIDKLRGDLASSAVTARGDATDAPTAGDEATEGPAAGKSTLGWRELEEGWREYRRTADELPNRADRLALLIERVSGTYIGTLLEGAIEYTDSTAFRQLVVEAAKRIAVGGWTVVSFAVNLLLGLTGVVVVLLYLVFLLLDFPQYARTWETFLPPQYRESIVEFTEQFRIAMRRYFRGQSIVALLVGTLFAIGFTIIGLPMAVPFGLFIGLLNMVPYLQLIGLVPAVLLAGLGAIDGDSSFAISIVLALSVFAVVQVIQDALITPRIMGKATGLRPVAILLGVFIWGKLLGFMGLLLAIPLTCLGIAYYRRYVLLHAPESTKIAPE